MTRKKAFVYNVMNVKTFSFRFRVILWLTFMFISVIRPCGLFKLNIKVYLELFDSHCLRQPDFYKIVYNSILCGLNQSDGVLFTKMATCRDPSDDLHYPIGNLSHIQSCSHRHAGNTVY